MEEENNVFGFIAFDILMMVFFVGFISEVFMLSGGFFIKEFFLLILFMILAIVLTIGIYKRKEWVWKYSTVFFAINLVNLFLIHIKIGGALKSMVLIFIAALCFLISIINIKKPEEEPELEVYDSSGDEEKDKEESSSVVKEYFPGKFVGSKKGTTYHTPKCSWAKKIRKNSQVWFNGRAEASKKGYKKCNLCIK